MKKKLFIIIPLIFLLSACGNKSNVSEVLETPATVEDKESFDNVFDMFASQVGDIRTEYEEKEVLEEEILTEDKTISDVDVRSYTDENLGVIINYLDVGNGEASLIESNGEFLLIDTGSTATSSELLEYVKSKTDTLKYLIITHPHSDRIGGVIDILNNINVEEVILPNIKLSNSSTFMEMLNILEEKEIKVTEAVPKDIYDLGVSSFEILAPDKAEYSDIDNYSICLNLRFGDNSFLFMGDAKSESEADILEKGLDVTADVIKVGTAGSRYSTSASFLDKVNPHIAVISVGKNSKGYPDSDTLSKLEKRNIVTYRTDKNGVISIGSDGTNLYAITEIAYGPKTTNSSTENKEETPVYEELTFYPEDADTFIVYAGRDKVYHLEGCDYITNISNEMTLSVAHNMGYTPCDKCHPPQVKE